ncbi:transcriptional regulator [Carboxydothermus islandicus]|uniref:Transcriptional regulator n=1 Tax=Carboxydothermus islandicus TaxID=661089 RepID=A0A1L8D3A1_9THEO|nr:transcriptional regulator [Carboxydothermus islandicus]
MANKLHISYWALCKYENNERTPDLELLWKMAQEFEVSIEYLAGLSDTNPPSAASPVIKKLSQLPQEALNEVDLFVDFLQYKYNLNGE